MHCSFGCSRLPQLRDLGHLELAHHLGMALSERLLDMLADERKFHARLFLYVVTDYGLDDQPIEADSSSALTLSVEVFNTSSILNQSGLYIYHESANETGCCLADDRNLPNGQEKLFVPVDDMVNQVCDIIAGRVIEAVHDCKERLRQWEEDSDEGSEE